MGSHPAEDGGHGAHSAPFSVIHRGILTDGGEELVMLQLMWLLAVSTPMPPCRAACRVFNAVTDSGGAVGALKIGSSRLKGSQHRPDRTVQLGAVRVFGLDKEVIK